METGYPTHWEADVVLRDGGTAHVRPIRPEDADALQAFHEAQSQQSTVFRFFAPLERLPEADLHRFTHVDHRDRVAFVAVADAPGGEQILAVARYDRDGTEDAEVAFNVADAHHGRGLGSVLLEHLAAAARERGVRHFTADVLPHNHRMLTVFREAGYAVTQRLEDGVLRVEFGIDPTETSLAVMADREQRAEARSMAGLLSPRSVLVLAEPGPGADLGLATAVARHLASPGDGPEVHTVGLADPVPGAHAVAGPAGLDSVDLVVLSVPAVRAAAALRACAHLRAHGVVVISGGFAETGPEGLERQRELLRVAHGAGMRVLGPSSYGFWRGAADGPAVNASLAVDAPRPGGVALFCQSAPLAVGLLASARRRGLGLSTFLSAGHRADVSGNDLMQFLRQDPSTTVAGLYLESIGNPRKFARVARRLAATMPVVVVTAGRSGHVVPAGHAVRRTRVPRRALDEMLRQSGVVRVDSQHQLLDVAQLFASQPLPTGRRVAVLAGSGALAALTAEAASAAGLTVAEQRAILPGGGHGPKDLARLEEELRATHAGDCDAVVVVHVPTLGAPDPRIAEAVARSAAAGRPTVAVILGLSGLTPELTAPGPDGTPRTVPAYATPEDAVAALAATTRYAAWRAADHGSALAPSGVDRPGARALVADVFERLVPGAGGDPQPVELTAEESTRLLACYGIRVWPCAMVADADAAVRAAERLGWPVALTAMNARLRHRVDLGGVRLDLPGPGALREAMAGVLAAHPDAGPWRVQQMAEPGASCVLRSTEDPRFGPVLSFGLAGDAVDLLGDVGYGVAPLSDTDVAEMVRSVRTSARLFGYRGVPPLDVRGLEDVLGRLSVMADDLPDLRQVELHPVVVGPSGVAVLAAYVAVAPAGRVDAGRRALPT
ncbi:GNAT family N-acetyltransferase [Isoptericola sp. b441]|uniref:GNAT family N-acetyltransferase n=1 Tax=Actinotalea lenta TaxID=3064654 RepID=A0ABT9DAJ4_9CELL|nr:MULTISPECIES: GNAT family N-acetyltransferase [unclassified Isoptericola]MDO8107927.1 GNAT family N-acetyltransferase [Isoptericola sp. b441]MDO8120406.1 GNAT family N-acetyltransferase [Isoptericola sp. b490]